MTPTSPGRGTSHVVTARSPRRRRARSSAPYSLPTRVGDPEGKTSPEELLAAAHGGCFAMSLAGELTAGRDAARAPRRALPDHDGRGRGPRASHRRLRTRGARPTSAGLGEEAFAAASRRRTGDARSRRSCASAGVEIDMTTNARELERRQRMATDRTAKVTWSGSLMDGGGHDRGRREWGVRPAGRQLGVAGGGARRQDEPGGADRGRVGVVLLDGALARARARRHAARAPRDGG